MGLLGTWSFDKLDLYIAIFAFLIAAALFRLKPVLPSIGTIQTAVELLNTKGGIIALLGTFTMIFFFTGLKFMYWSAGMISSGKVDPNNAIIISGFNWITGIAFGGVFGAMIKTMTGESPPPPTVQTTSISQSKTFMSDGTVKQEVKEEKPIVEDVIKEENPIKEEGAI